jgi:zinc-ribbon domain
VEGSQTCSRCGAVNTADARFCPRCGEPGPGASSVSHSAPSRPPAPPAPPPSTYAPLPPPPYRPPRAMPSSLTLVGAALSALAAGVFIISLLLHFYFNISLWDATTREPVILTILASLAILCALASLSWSSPVFTICPVAIGCYLFGQIFPVGASSYSGLQVGFWLATGSAIVVAVGGSLALLGRLATSARSVV